MKLPRPASFLLLAAALCVGLVAVRHGLGQGAPPMTTTEKDGMKQVRNLPYVQGGHPRQRLDLYLPLQSTGVRPLVVWIHGGGWQGGSKDDLQAKYLVENGYIVASVEYRMSQDAIYPAQIEDCKSALRWLRAHAAEYEIDPAHVGVWGASAGGHLVALLGTTGQIRDFDRGENLDQSSAVQCVIDWFGPADFLHWGAENTTLKGESAISHLLGGPVPEKTEQARRASPISFVSKESAPFLILHGDQDPLVPLQQSIVLHEALQKAGVPSKLITLPGAKHGGKEFTALEQVMEMSGFLTKYLKTPGK